MKYLTVKEYAEHAGIKLAAAYKRVKEDRCNYERKFGRILVKVKDKE